MKYLKIIHFHKELTILSKIYFHDLIGGTRSFSAKMQNFIKKTIPTWKLKDCCQYSTQSIAESKRTKFYGINEQNVMEHSSKSELFNDSDLLSRENWRKKIKSLFLCNKTEENKYLVLNDVMESSNENFEQLVKNINDAYIPINTNCDTEDLSLSALQNSKLSNIENQISGTTGIETERNDSKILDYESLLVTNSKIKNELIIEQKTIQLETKKYFEYKPLHSKFISAYPEIKLNNKLVTKNIKCYLLENASYCGTYKIDGKIYFLKNSCPFDSLAQIVFTGVLDDPGYFAIAETSDNSFLKFIFKFVNNGPSHEVYKERIMLLKPLYEGTKIIIKTGHYKIIYSYNAEDNPVEVWMKLLKSIPSSRQIEKCDICGEHETVQLTLMLNHKIIIKKGFHALQKALKFREIIYKRCQCGGHSVLTTEINYHIFIELDIRTNLQSTSKSCKLENLPIILTLKKQYRYDCFIY